MYRHVLCVYPYRVGVVNPNFFPPIGLEIIAAALEKHAAAVDVVDLRRESGRTIDFLRPETDLVAFSVNWDKERTFVREEIRSVPPDVLTVVGGRHATEDPEKWLRDCPNVNVLVRGDGEEVMEEVARGRPLEDVARNGGISYRLVTPTCKGKVIHGPNRRTGPAADDLYPRRRLRRYTYTMTLDDFDTGTTVDSVAASRGCPFNCTYCSFSRNPWGTKRKWSGRSPESIVRELEEIDARLVIFTDDIFTHDMDRVEEICDLILERGIRKRYVTNARLEMARRPDVVKKMERAGFSVMLLGIESTQDRTLRSMRKGFDTRKIREYFRALRRSRMVLHGYFIIGNVGETEREMLSIPRFAHELGVDSLGLSILRNSPYSGLDELVAATPGYHVRPDGHIFSDALPFDKLRAIRRRVQRTFFSPGHVLHFLKKVFRNELITPGIAARLLLSRMLPRRRRRKGSRG